MIDLILFTTQGRRVAVNQSDILLILDKNEKNLTYPAQRKAFNEITALKPINSQYTQATQFIYFDGEQQLECIGVSDVKYLENFKEENIVDFKENMKCNEIIGFVNEGGKRVPIIDILNLLDWLL